MAFQTKISRSRFVYGPFSGEQMAAIGTTVLSKVVSRIQQGVNTEDQPAKPLKPAKVGRKGYPERKILAGLLPIRSWISPTTWPRGRMKLFRALQVKAANENRVIIGFIDPSTEKIAHVNNKRERQFGLSPSDELVARKAVFETAKQMRVVRVQKAS